MTNKTKVSVIVPAFNEEKNIVQILNDILSQRQNGWELEEIFVYSDGSTDKTVEAASSINNTLIKIVGDSQRLGKVQRIQQFFKKAKGEILVMFDADIKIKDCRTINFLVEAFNRDNRIMLASGNSKAFSPQTFFQRGVYGTFKVFYKSRLTIRKGDNLFACTGACLAVKNSFASEINFPQIKNEDTFLYFTCKKKKYKFAFVKEAVVYYKLPGKLSDYLSQIFRSNPEAVKIKLTKYFGNLVNEEYKRGTGFYFKNIIKVLLEDPLPVLYISFINLLTKPFFRIFSGTNKMTWNPIITTK